jgi:hypothetical protein
MFPAEHYRQRAEHCLRLAKTARTCDMADWLRSTAADYAEKAAEAEAEVAADAQKVAGPQHS